MKSKWIPVFIAAFFEILWVIGLTHAYSFWSWAGTFISILISTCLMIRAGRKIPVGTVYAVFVGLGTEGTIISEIIFFDKPFQLSKILLILLLLIGVWGLKLTTKDTLKEGEEH